MSGFTDRMLTNYHLFPRVTVSLPRRESTIARLQARFGRWRRRIQERRALAQFSDRDLLDIGLTRVDVMNEISKPFWRD